MIFEYFFDGKRCRSRREMFVWFVNSLVFEEEYFEKNIIHHVRWFSTWESQGQ